MVESEPVTLRLGEPERAVRTVVPYRAESVFALTLRRKEPGKLGRTSDGELAYGHWTPETPEQIERSGKITQRMQELMQDDVLGEVLLRNLMDMADGRLVAGEISEEQYLAIHDAYEVGMGDGYKRLEVPESLVQQYGSIRSQQG